MKINKCSGRGGFTLFELIVIIIVSAIMFICAIIFTSIPMANCWFTTDGVAREIGLKEPHADQVEVVTYKRNFFSFSEFTVRLKNSEKIIGLKKYALDTNILFNYEVWPK